MTKGQIFEAVLQGDLTDLRMTSYVGTRRDQLMPLVVQHPFDLQREYIDEPRTSERYLLEHILWRNPQRCIDLGCGSGKIAKWLQDKMPEVIACDIDLGCLDTAKRIGVNRLFGGDFTTIDDPIDLILFLGGGFPISKVNEPKNHRAEFRNFLNSISEKIIDGGWLLLDTISFTDQNDKILDLAGEIEFQTKEQDYRVHECYFYPNKMTLIKEMKHHGILNASIMHRFFDEKGLIGERFRGVWQICKQV